MSNAEKSAQTGTPDGFASSESKSVGSRADTVRKDLSDRLKGVCQNLSTSEFQALVAKMTREQLRGEGNPPPERRKDPRIPGDGAMS